MTGGDPFSPPLIIHMVRAASLSAGSRPSVNNNKIATDKMSEAGQTRMLYINFVNEYYHGTTAFLHTMKHYIPLAMYKVC